MKPKPTKRKRKQKEDEIENDIEAEFDNLKAELPVMSLKLGMDHCLPLEPIQSSENPFISTNFTSTNCLSSFEGT
jgi:hypothetical protein